MAIRVLRLGDECRGAIGQFINSRCNGAAIHPEDVLNLFAGQTTWHLPDGLVDHLRDSVDMRLH